MRFMPLVLTLGAFLFLVTWPFRFPVDPGFWSHAMDACHLPLFLGLTLVFHHYLRGWNHRFWTPRLTAGGIAALLAAVTEWLQPLVGRDDSLQDFFNGFLGITIAVTGLAAFKPGVSTRPRTVWAGLSLAAILYVGWPAWQEWRGISLRERNFPILGDFENPAELRVWYPQGGTSNRPTQIAISSARATRGRHSLQVQLGSTDWPGVNFNAGVMNFSGYRRLAFDIHNPGAMFDLILRVDDDGDCSRQDSRCLRGFQVTNGWNHLVVPVTELERAPKTRRLNLRAIRRLVLFSDGQAAPSLFWLDNVRLE